jgi:hypothetical protein
MKQSSRTAEVYVRSVFAGGIALFVLLAAAGVNADFASSTNFLLSDGAIDLWGGEATSTNFSFISGGETISGYSTSTNFTLSSGGIDSGSFTPKSQNWRFYDDEINLPPTTALAAENTSPTGITDGNILKLRLTLKETASVGSNVKFRLQYATSTDFAHAKDLSEQGSCSGTSGWCYANGSGSDNQVLTSAVLSDPETCSIGTTDGCGTVNESGTSTSTILFDGDRAKEFEFTITANGSSPNTTYYFRAIDTNSGFAADPNTGETYPSLVSGGTNLTFTISGLSAGVSTEGVTTDIETTPTTISFGSLPLNGQVEGAQRLLVTTNATEGYQLFVFQDQGLVNQGLAEIPGVSATNPTPNGWSTACAATSTGCYGYHAGDDTLGGGSARFAPNDSFARLETAPREIAHSSLAVASDTVDVVYRTQVRIEQESGDYTSNVSYIVVPVF